MIQKIITICNAKGGVGKTTSTASIGACMALMGKKFLHFKLNIFHILFSLSILYSYILKLVCLVEIHSNNIIWLSGLVIIGISN